ncbi:alkaline phosphatase, tissue-nonspecific isozyme-like [Anopheles stephensi]|uniref:alkaline phosphatase, tissue-nonspecific isozyme-like n=1 Tax=Anopheles stephensi TaxID=30069 RepID=UPI00165889FF|nr:alkaline phosphatase, tissue-nonspecific isozyme-like [Anopheles stephensi]
MAREEFNVATIDSAEGSFSAQQWSSYLDGGARDRENAGKRFARRTEGCGFSALCVGLLIAIVFAIVLLCVGFIVVYENEGQVVATVDLFTEDLPPEQAVWFDSNLAELRNAFRVVEENKKRAKNVILFVALDSAVPSFGDYPRPIWESFPHLALLRPTTMVERTARASFSPTSMFCGIETGWHTIGFDSAVKPWDTCVSTPNSSSTHHHHHHQAASILQWAQTVGRRTGVITNGEIVQPFPAALYAHAANASWLHDSPDMLLCPDVRSQLLRGPVGKKLNVIAGKLTCPDEFCREAFEAEWENERLVEGTSYKVVNELSDLLDPTLHDAEYSLGLYDQSALAESTAFRDLVVGALNVLESPEGFVLVAIADPSDAQVVVPREIDSAVRATLKKLSGALDDSLIVVVRSDVRDGDAGFATVHAIGPMSHLLHRVHNETFLAHFISYAARIGRFRDADLTNLILQIV